MIRYPRFFPARRAESVKGLAIRMAVLTALLAAAQTAMAQARVSPADYARIDRALAAGAAFLSGQIAQDGKCAGEYPEGDFRFGGKTALAVHAMLSAGADANDQTVQRVVKWLASARLEGTYAVAARACAMSALKDDQFHKLLAQDVQWLVRAASKTGSYTYTSSGGKPIPEYDNSNAQMAVLGVWAGARRGVPVPRAYWELVARHWLDQQQPDGGWGYLVPSGSLTGKTYGSMTAAGLATMYICLDGLGGLQIANRDDPYDRCDKALGWLGKHFDAACNPRLGGNWHCYWLYSLGRAGLASGRRYIGGHDWYGEAAAQLLAMQNEDGSWGHADRIADTAFAVMLLARGRDPIVMNKLCYRGQWNSRPRDLANLAEWFAVTMEQPAAWQVVDFDSDVRDWHNAPVLYVSGAGAAQFTDEQIQKLRTFALQGGLILSESVASNASFTLDVTKAYARMFPHWPLTPLAPDHPIYSLQFKPADRSGLLAVSNGARILAIHSPRELSLGLQNPAGQSSRACFELMANVYALATDGVAIRRRPQHSHWPKAEDFEPARRLKVARVKYKGNYDPEPLAWQRLAILAGTRHRILLEVSQPMPITQLDAGDWPVAAMTGTEAFSLTTEEAEALRAYLAAGGRLILDAAGGSKAFAAAVEKQIVPVVGGDLVLLAPSHPIYADGPEGASKVSFRRDYAGSLGSARNYPRLKALFIGESAAVVFSAEDITCGILGQGGYKLAGYGGESAVALMLNAVVQLSQARLVRSEMLQNAD